MSQMDTYTANDTTSQDAKIWPQDTGTLNLASRKALNKLLKRSYLSATDHKAEWDALISDTKAIRSQLSNLFTELVLDEQQGVAFIRNARAEETVLPSTVRTVSLTFIDTILMLHLRRELVREAGADRVLVTKDEVYEHLKAYLAGSTDEVGDLKRFETAWTRFTKQYHLLAATNSEGRFEISPVIRLIFGPEQIAHVTEQLNKTMENAS